MAGRVQKESLITLGGLILYIGGIVLKIRGELPVNIEFWCFFAAYLLSGYGVFKNIAENFSRKIFLEGNLLMVIATVGTLSIGHYIEGGAVILIFQIGNLMDKFTSDRTKRKIRELIDIHVIYATQIIDGEEVRVEPQELREGDVIVVKPGESVPVDGVILSGVTTMDTQMITGEAMPRVAEAGSMIYSGSINLSGAVEVKVVHTYRESTVSKILSIVEDGEKSETESAKKIRKRVRNYSVAVLLVAVAITVVPAFVVENYEYRNGVERSLVFLVAACPCAVNMSVTIAFLGGILAAAKRGIIVKGGNYLEILSKVNTFIFDKTGTLTEGIFEVQEVHALGRSEEELLEIAAHIESFSNHPIALSLKEAYGRELDSSRITELEEIPGYGLSAVYEGQTVYLGNARLMREKNMIFQQIHKTGSIIYIAVEKRYAGYIVISDKIKRDVKQMLNYLRKNCHAVLAMVTGDTQFTGEAVAKILNLDYYYANQLPEDKVKRLEEFMEMQDETEYLAAVGDGINDAPLLAKADVGIAMGAFGSDAAIEAADIVLMDDEPMAVVDAVRIAKETMKVIRQNTRYAVFVKIIVLLLAVLGVLSMRKAVIAEVCVIIIAIFNAAWASKEPV